MKAVVDGKTTPIDLANASNTPEPLLGLAVRCCSLHKGDRPTFEEIAALLTADETKMTIVGSAVEDEEVIKAPLPDQAAPPLPFSYS